MDAKTTYNNLTNNTMNTMTFSDIFVLEDIQRIQDMFSDATGVASIITQPDGTPITKPSNFSRLCSEIIRKTEKGRVYCYHSDACIGRQNSSEPIVQTCLSGGLWDAGASITVGGQHIANWLIGQVRNEKVDVNRMVAYADEIGVNRSVFIEALNEVPVMSSEQFGKIAKMLFAFAGELSEKAYSNLKLKLQIAERERANELLRESEENLSITLHSIGDGVIATDKSGLITMMNPIAEHLTGWSFIDAKNQPLNLVFKILNKISREVLENPVEKVLATGKITTLANHTVLVCRNGEEYQISDSAAPIRDNQGNIRGVILVFSDVSEQYKAEDSLKVSEDKYQTMIDYSNDLIWTLDNNGNFTFFNEIVSKTTGLKLNEWKGKSFVPLIMKEDLPMIMDVFQENMKGKPCNYELRFKKPDESILTISVNTSPIYVLGKIEGVVSFGRDTTLSKQVEKSLRESEEKYRMLTESMKDVVWSLDTENFRFIYISPSIQQLRGYTPEEIINQPADAAMMPYAVDFLKNLIIQRIEQFLNNKDSKQKFYSDKVEQPCKDGSTVWTEIISHFCLNEKTGHVELLGVTRDISEQNRIEIVLRESEERYRLLSDVTIEGILIHKNGITKDLNSALSKLIGYEREELLNQNIMDFIYHDDRYIVLENIIKKYSGSYEVRAVKKNGEVFFAEIEARNFQEQGQELRVAAIRDITLRKQSEEKLRESEQRYRLLIETANEGIVVAQGSFLKFVNPKAHAIIERTEEELLTIPFVEFIYQDDRELIKNNYLKRVNNEAVTQRYPFRILTKDNSTKWIELGSVKIDWEGQPATLNFLTDISERIEAEQEIKTKTEELTKINAEKNKFFSIIAHDLRSPLNGFIGLTQIMAEELSSLTMEEVQEIAVSMRNSATNLFRLLENLLHWSRIQQGLMPFDPEVLSLHPVIDESVEILWESAKSKEIEIIHDIPAHSEVFADLNLLQTVIRNLVSNAIKFTPKGGKINISAMKTNDNKVQISIVDTGIGISPKLVDQLFSLDVKTGRKGTDGELSTGLGLLLCKEFIELQGGKIWVVSVEGKGSTFSFTIPCKSNADNADCL